MRVVPVEGIALVLGVDRFMSEARAITNVIGNAVATVVIARNEGRSRLHLTRRQECMRNGLLCGCAAAITMVASAHAQITDAEFAARRDSLAARIDSGGVVAFGGRTPVTDFGPFFQLPAFHYLTEFDEPDAAFVMVVRRWPRRPARSSHADSTPRTAFYYGWRPDSADVPRTLGLEARSFSALAGVVDSLAATALPFYTLRRFRRRRLRASRIR